MSRVELILTLLLVSIASGQENQSTPGTSGKTMPFSRFKGDMVTESWRLIWNSDSITAIGIASKDTISVFRGNLSLDESEKDGYEMLSIAGPYISYGYRWHTDRGPVPDGGGEYRTWDLGRLRLIKLDELVDSSVLLGVLLAETLITTHLKVSRPSTLSELVHNLEGRCDVEFSNLFTSFAFYSFEDTLVTVEILLNSACNRRWSQSYRLHLKLPSSPTLNFHLIQARWMRTLLRDHYGKR